MFKVKMIRLLFIVAILIPSKYSANPKNEFNPSNGIHPYYLDQMPGLNNKECSEKIKCRKECPEITKRPGFTKGLSQVYERNECLRNCDKIQCILNNSF